MQGKKTRIIEKKSSYAPSWKRKKSIRKTGKHLHIKMIILCISSDNFTDISSKNHPVVWLELPYFNLFMDTMVFNKLQIVDFTRPINWMLNIGNWINKIEIMFKAKNKIPKT